MGYCSKCGEQLADKQSICMGCGCSTNKEEIEVRKSRMVAGLLQIFLGSFGIGRFYLGYNQIGTIQLILGVLGSTVSFLNIIIFLNLPFVHVLSYAGYIVAVWGVIDGILILSNKRFKDAQGNELTN